MNPDSTVTGASAHPNGHPDRYPTVTLAEYAVLTGQSARTVRDKVRRGVITAELMKGPHGFEYRLCHPDSTVPGTLPKDCGQSNSQADGQPTDTVTTGFGQSDSSLGELVALVRDQQDQITRLNDERAELYGRLGFLQARVQGLEQEVRLLKVPQSTLVDSPDVNHGSQPAVQNCAQSSDPAPVPTPNPPSGEQNGPVRGAECSPRGPWWRFWEIF